MFLNKDGILPFEILEFFISVFKYHVAISQNRPDPHPTILMHFSLFHDIWANFFFVWGESKFKYDLGKILDF